MKSVLEEISRQLAQIGTSGSFATRRTAAAGDLNLKVRDVGSIRLPVTTSTARRLCEVARPARHGFKDETRLDRRVRDTWEIPKSRISIDEPRWMRTLTPQVDRIRRDLGLPEECRLKARLHNMPVYATGQFFVPHQDSEKTDDMIGTLVVSLPSRFSGGAMAIERSKELSRLCKPIVSLMESSRIASQPDLHAQVIEFLTGGAPDLPVYVPFGLLQAAHEHRQSHTLRSLGLKPVHMHCTQDLTTRLNAPVRPNDDWSIATSLRCSCKQCATLTRYLRAQDNVRFEWPLAKSERAHIHGIVDSHDLPVTHMTRRTGRPFTLILEKTAAVFERDAVERRLWQSALQWLMKTVADF